MNIKTSKRKILHQSLIKNLVKCEVCGEYNGSIEAPGVSGGHPIVCICKHQTYNCRGCGDKVHLGGMHYYSDEGGLQYVTSSEFRNFRVRCQKCFDKNNKDTITIQQWLEQSFIILRTAKIYFDDSRLCCTYLIHWGLELVLKVFLFDKVGDLKRGHDIKKLYKECRNIDPNFPEIKDLISVINPAGKNNGGIRYPDNKIEIKNISPIILTIYIDKLHKYICKTVDLKKEIILDQLSSPS